MRSKENNSSPSKGKITPQKKSKTAEVLSGKKSPLVKQKILEVVRQKDNKSFIEKFKDKHSIISKQGLLKLFEKHTFKSCNFFKNNQENKLTLQPKVESPQQLLQNHNNKLTLKAKEKSLEKIKIQEIIKARAQRKNSQASVAKSVQLPELNPKLSKIQKSISTTVHLREKLVESPLPKAQTDTIPRQLKKVQASELKSKNKFDSYNFELDKFALDHLDFLDRFQERIKRRQLTPHLS